MTDTYTDRTEQTKTVLRLNGSAVTMTDGWTFLPPEGHVAAFSPGMDFTLETRHNSLVTGCRVGGVWLWRKTDADLADELAHALDAARADGPEAFKEPPPRPADSNLAKHAWDELDRAGLFTNEGDFYGGMTGRAVLDIVQMFARQGHSGTSASVVIDLVTRLLRFEALSDLTDDPSEWMEVADGLWQSRRMSEAFSRDGGRTYRRNSTGDKTYTSVSSRGAHGGAA